CECALRDWSATAGEYDDRFAMTITCFVLADIEASGVPVPLRILGIEHSQCTQYFRSELLPYNRDNSIAMVAGKDTVFRVYVATTNDPSSPTPIAITGQLEIRPPGHPDWTVLMPINGPIAPRLGEDIDRRNRDHTLNFVIPGFLCHGMVEYR